MRRCFGHIVAIAAFSLILLASCKEEDKVIPRDKLARIYAEMLMTDQWIAETPNVRRIADTSLVYDPILEKYGYDSDDYRKSMDHYMDDPERFEKVFRKTNEILDLRIKELNIKKHELEQQEAKKRRIERFRKDLNMGEYFPYLHGKPYVRFHDSLSVAMDEFNVYRLEPVVTADTLFDRIRIVIPEADTLSTAVPSDTVEAAVKAEPVLLKLDSVRLVNPKRLRKPRSMTNEFIKE